MLVSRENDDFEPLTWARGVPIYATTLLVAVHVAALITGWVAMGMHYGSLLEPQRLIPRRLHVAKIEMMAAIFVCTYKDLA